MRTMPSRVKNQHYVPRFLLREFSVRGGVGRPQVWCFDKQAERSFRTAVENVCAERSFYDFGSDQGGELAFAEMEGKLSQCHSTILKTRSLSLLPDHERVGLAVLVATQHMRTRAFRNGLKEAAAMAATDDNATQSVDAQRIMPSPTSDGSKEEPAKRLQFQLMNRALSAFTESLLEMKWILLVNKTASPFWCSDNPFTYSNPFPYDPLDGLGFERPGSQTHFPLSHDLSLSIADPRFYAHHPDITLVDEIQNIIYNNHLQVQNAERFVFSCVDDFVLASEMVSRDPRLREPAVWRRRHLDLD